MNVRIYLKNQQVFVILYKFASFSTIIHFFQRTGQGFQQEFSTSVLKSRQIPNKQRLLILSFPVFPHIRMLKTRKFHCKKAMKKTFCQCLNGEIKNFFRVFSRKNYTFRLYMYLHVIKRYFRYIFSSHTVFSSIYFKVKKNKSVPHWDSRAVPMETLRIMPRRGQLTR